MSGTTYIISAEDNEDLCASVGISPAADGTAHPIFFYIAPQVGMGETVAGLCAVCKIDVNDGPMLGGCSAEFTGPLKVDTPYRVTGKIVSLTRKVSKKLGIMDVLEYRLSLNHDDRSVLTVTNSWILPREAGK